MTIKAFMYRLTYDLSSSSFFFPAFSISSLEAVPTKVKKTDLPIMPPESEILPSLDDSEDNFSEDLADDDDDIEDQDEMVADEPLETLEEEDEDDDYDSEEDTPTLDTEMFKDGLYIIPITAYNLSSFMIINNIFVCY